MLVALLLLSCGWLVAVNVLWLAVLRVGQGYVIVVFPDHTHLLFNVCSQERADNTLKKSCDM